MRITAALGAAGLFLAATPALADPRLDELVYSPYVANHTIELETRFGQTLGHGELAGARTEVIEVEAGLSDRLSLALVGTVERPAGEPERLSGLGLESIVYLGRLPLIGLDAGAYVELTRGLAGEPDKGEAKLLLAKTEGRFQGLANLIVERPFAGPAGTVTASYGYAASATWRTFGNLRLGAEALGDLGDDHRFLSGPQGAYVGPQLKWEGRPGFLPVEVELDAGWLAAVGPARAEAPSQLRVNLEFEHRF